MKFDVLRKVGDFPQIRRRAASRQSPFARLRPSAGHHSNREMQYLGHELDAVLERIRKPWPVSHVGTISERVCWRLKSDSWGECLNCGGEGDSNPSVWLSVCGFCEMPSIGDQYWIVWDSL